MKPTFILQVYNPEFYRAQNNEPMPILLTRSEYWELSEVDGLDPSFCGLDVETTTDKEGNQNITTTYDGRDISFTISLFTPHIEDSLEFFSRYLVTGVYAILRIAEKPGLYLKCKIANYEFNRWANGAEVVINLQAMDRFWHFDYTEENTAGGFTVISDVATKPYIKDSTPHVTGADGYTLDVLIIEVSHESLYFSDYDKEVNTKTDIQRLVFSGINLSLVDTTKFHCEIDSEKPACYMFLGENKYDITSHINLNHSEQVNYSIWDWMLQPGFSNVTVTYRAISSSGTHVSTGNLHIDTRPKFVTYPKGLTNDEVLYLSHYLLPENIRLGVSILGVTGTYIKDMEIYTGETEITPTLEDKTLETAGKGMGSDITIKAISPVLNGASVQNNVTTTPTTAGAISTKILNKSEEVYYKARVDKSAWFNAGSYDTTPHRCEIDLDEQAKIIPENIKDGVTILGVTGTVTAPNIELFGDNQSKVRASYNIQYYIKEFNIIEPIILPANCETLFADCIALEKLNLTGVNTEQVIDINAFFWGCTVLTDVIWGDNWASNSAVTSCNVSYSPLSHDSCLDLFNKLATRTNSPTLALSSTTKGYMSDEELAIATDKGWTVA